MVPTLDLRLAVRPPAEREMIQVRVQRHQRRANYLAHIARVDEANARALERWRAAQAECFRRGELDRVPPRPACVTPNPMYYYA